jgi:predicted DNA-binding transcriptional regulator AlpA
MVSRLLKERACQMDELFKGLSIKSAFEAQVTAALMVQSNALIPIKLAVKLCGISRQEIDRRVHDGSFPRPTKLSRRKNSMRKAFYLKDLHNWIRNPQNYRQEIE